MFFLHLFGGVVFLLLLFGWGCFFPLLFGGVAFLRLLWEVVRFTRLLLGGAAWSPPSFWVVLLFFLLLLVVCSFITSFFVPSLSGVAFPFLLRGAAWFLLPPLVLLGLLLPWRCFPLLSRGAAWFLPSFGVLCCLAVLPSIPSFGWWCCLVSSFLGVVFLSFYVVLLGFFLFGCSLLFGGAAVRPLLWVVVLLGFLLPFGCCCFSFSCWVVLLGLLLPWRCFHLLLRCAAWFLPSLGALCCLAVLPSIPSFGWWCCLVSSFLLGVVFPSPVGWCCLVSSFLGVVFLSFHVVLLGFFPFWVVLLFSFSCLVALSSSPPVGGAAFSHVFCWVVLLGFLLPFGGVAVFPSPAGWGSPPKGGEGRQHHQTGETTQRVKKTKQHHTTEDSPTPKEEKEGSITKQEKEKQQHHQKEEETKQHHTTEDGDKAAPPEGRGGGRQLMQDGYAWIFLEPTFRHHTHSSLQKTACARV